MSRVLLRPLEVCERLAIGNHKMHTLIADGELEAIQLGPKGTRVYEDSLESFIERKTVTEV